MQGGEVCASHNRRQTIRVGPQAAYAQVGIVGFDGPIDVQALRLYGLPEDAPALLCGTPALPMGRREFAAEVSWDLPSLAPGATSLLDVTVAGSRQGDLAHAALAASTRFARRPCRRTCDAARAAGCERRTPGPVLVRTLL
jgi:hypothetical protein